MSADVSKLDAYWMPFTANRQFKKAPRLLAKAQGMYYWTPEGRQILDGVAGLWCVNAGHARPKIVQAIQAQAAEMDYAPAPCVVEALHRAVDEGRWTWSSPACSTKVGALISPTGVSGRPASSDSSHSPRRSCATPGR